MRRILPLFLFLMLFTGSCYYMDTETYRVEVESTYNPFVQITSNLDDVDSIFVADSFLFKYEIEIDTGRLFFADLFIGNYQIYRSDTLRDSLWIYPYYIEMDGDYVLTLAAYYKSYSESLADRLNAEFFIADTSWIFSIRRELP